jgi:murein DD-endopeptidase MepM/ murein hydrolase activator NlpD
MISLFVTGVDHDPEEHGDRSAICTSYLGYGFPDCYDGHGGSDILLAGGFEAMDEGSVEVLAAADGEVVETEDGHYDRCHADAEAEGGISCDGYGMEANYVVILHATGDTTRYYHLMQDSVVVEAGEAVSQGDVLGRVGSSGVSSTPHLHFELRDAQGVVVDPYAGPYSQEETWWCAQNERGELPGGCEEAD